MESMLPECSLDIRKAVNSYESTRRDARSILGEAAANECVADDLDSRAMCLERKTGYEPVTLSLATRCSTTEPLPPNTSLKVRRILASDSRMGYVYGA